MKPFCSIPEAIHELKKQRMLIVVDDPKRENQGDVIFPAEKVTTSKVNFLLKHCRGIICVPLTKAQAQRLDLPLMMSPIDNTEITRVQFTVTVDAKNVQSFGISASDRAKTIASLASKTATAADLVRPGHIFPLLSRDGGVIERPGHTEATTTLMKLAGFTPVGVLCEILKDNGEVARLPDLVKFAKKFNLKIISIANLVDYIKEHPMPKLDFSTVTKQATASLPTHYGTFQVIVYKSFLDNREHVVLSKGNIKKQPVLTRVHSQCFTGDTLFSLRCDCRQQLHRSLELINKAGSGIILYLNQEGRGIGLVNKIKAYALQDKGLDTVEANLALHLPIDARDYKIASEILCDLGISKINLLTNNPAKIEELKMLGITVVKQIALEMPSNDTSLKYLRTKKQKLGHLLNHI